MAQRDVELRLRARDDASKNVRKVSEALKQIASDAESAAKGAGKTGSALGTLAADVARLQAESSKLKSFGIIATQLDRATAAVERSENALRGAQGEFARVAAESDRAAFAAANFRAQTEAQAAALERNKQALVQTRTEQAKANEIVRQAERDQLALNAARSQRVSGNRASAGVGTESGAPVSSAKASMGVFLEADLANAKARQTQLNAAIKNYADAVQASTSALKESKVQTAASAREQKGLADEVERAGQALLAARADAAANWKELERIDEAALKASAALGGLAVKQDDIARASRRTAEELARTQRALEAYSKFSTGGKDVADPKTAAVFQRQNAVIREAKDDLAALREETTRLAVEIRNTSGNATKQVDAFNRMSAASRAAEAEVQKQIVAMNRLRGVTQGGGFGAWAKAVIPLQQTTAAVTATTGATQQLTNAQGRLAPAATRSGSALTGLANAANQSGAALRKSAADSRTALSLVQRLRGEVLSLTASYVGLFAVIGGITESVNAFRTLEGVQSRLGAVFAQDTAKVATEIDFLRDEADRLGISFASLGDQYGKFAIAAKSANFSAENTRKIFLSVAEAGRVNKLSLDQLNGTFLAIEQIISKGKFTSEEVRRQLGDRLPGAFNILADAMGVTTMELDKMMSGGDLLATESNLLAFANEMTSKFGPQLSASLDTVSTDLGRFQNNLFKIQLAIANGFIPELREALQAFNEFANSPEGSRTFAELGAVIGRVIRILAEVPQYFDKIVLAAKAFAAIKLSGAFVNLAQRALETRASFGNLSRQMAFIGPQMQQMTFAQRVLGQGFAQVIGTIDSYRARLMASTATTAVARVGTMAFATTLGVLRSAMLLTANVARTLWAAIGGIPGLIATGIVFAIGSWITGIDNATTALSEHDRQLAALRKSYHSVGDAAANWFEKVNGVTLSQAIRSTEELRQAYADARKEFEEYSRLAEASFANFEANSPERKQAKALNDLSRQFADGTLTLEEYRSELEAIALSPVNDELKGIADSLLDMLNTSEDGALSVEDLRKAVETSEAKLRLMNGTATIADKVMLGLVEAVEEVNETFDKSVFITTYTDAIGKLKEEIPELADEMKQLKDITDLNKIAWEGMIAALQAGDIDKIREITELWDRAVGAINAEAVGKATGSFVDKVVGVESGGNANAQNPNSSATGLGQFISSTWLSMFKKHFPDQAAGMSDAMILELRKNADYSRNMVQLYAQENAAVLQAAGYAITDANLYLAHFLGSGGAKSVLGADPSTPVDQILGADQISANGSILAGKTAGQVVDWAQQKMGISEAEIGVIDEINTAESDRLTKLKEQTKATEERLAQNEFDIRQQQLINADKEREAAIEAAVREAKLENSAISEAELTQIREQTATLYDQQAPLNEQAEATKKRLGQTAFEIEQQKLINAGKERQAAIEEAIRAAKAENPKIGEAELAQIREQTAALYDQQHTRDGLNLAEERVNNLYLLRQQLLEQQKLAEESGDFAMVDGLNQRLTEINAQTATAVEQAIAMWAAIGGPEADAAIAKLQTMGMSLQDNTNRVVAFGATSQQISTLVGSGVNGLIGVFDAFAKSIAEGGNAFQATGIAFLQFAADFLRQIAMMILQQVLLNALAGMGGPIGAAAAGLGGMTGHTGGLVGSAAIGGGNRIGDRPAWVRSAYSYHSGGVAGLAPDEVSATLKRGEEILTEEDPRHRFNMGGEQESGGGRDRGIKQILAIGEDELANAMAGAAGEKMIITHIKRSATTIKRILG